MGAEEKLQSSSSSSVPGPSPSSLGGEKSHNALGAEEKLQSSISNSHSLSRKRRSLLVDEGIFDEEEEEQVLVDKEKVNFRKKVKVVFSDDDVSLRDTDDDDDAKLQILSPGKSRIKLMKNVLGPVNEVQSGRKEDEESDQVGKANDAAADDDYDDYDDDDDVQVPYQQSKAHISSRLLFKTQDSEDEEEEEEE